jgi:hypothetical protein
MDGFQILSDSESSLNLQFLPTSSNKAMDSVFSECSEIKLRPFKSCKIGNIKGCLIIRFTTPEWDNIYKLQLISINTFIGVLDIIHLLLFI